MVTTGITVQGLEGKTELSRRVRPAQVMVTEVSKQDVPCVLGLIVRCRDEGYLEGCKKCSQRRWGQGGP